MTSSASFDTICGKGLAEELPRVQGLHGKRGVFGLSKWQYVGIRPGFVLVRSLLVTQIFH